MLRRYLALPLMLLFSGCVHNNEQVTANFQYSNAGNLGTQNAGLFEPGSLFLWDTTSNRLSFLDVIPLTRVGGSPAPADVESANVAGIEFTGIPVGADDKLLKAAIGASASFVAKSAVREDYGRLISALADYTTDLINQGADPDSTLRPREPGMRLVLIRSAVRANSSELRIGGIDATEPNSVVAVNLGDTISLSVRAGSSTSCAKPAGSGSSTTAPVCFFNASVFDPEYQEGNPRLQFLQRSTGDDQLSNAFRRLR